MRHDLVPGSIFPDYQLSDHTDKPRKLSELEGDDPLILTLSRGHYCPKEHQQHLELASFYPKIAVGYTQIPTISTDDHHTLQEFRASVGAQWTFLSDPEGPRYPGVHGSQARSDDSAHPGAQTRSRDSPHLERLLVLGPSFVPRSLARPARRHK